MHSKKRFFYTLFIAAAISVSACTMSTAAEPDQEELNLIKAAQEMRAAGAYS